MSSVAISNPPIIQRAFIKFRGATKTRAGKITLALIVLNEIRGLAFVGGIVWAWLN